MAHVSRRSKIAHTFLSALLMALFAPVALAVPANPGIDDSGEWYLPGPGVVRHETNEPGEDIYIVRHQAPSLAQYRGDIPGYAATSPAATGAKRLDVHSAASRAYLSYLSGLHSNLKAAIDTRVGRDVEVVFHYDVVLNGIAVRMTAAEAQQVSRLAGIRSVTRDFERQLLTDNGPRWIGADAVWGQDPPAGNVPCVGTCGEGVVVGIIDTGVNFNHPSFADVGGDGYDHNPPAGMLTYLGACAAQPVGAPGPCNDKLIGYYDFTGTGPEDDNGHGSHTASTTAGNVLDITLEGHTINLERSISGVAPHANVISYKGCSGTPVGCQLSALLASINRATADAVDVINYSIGGSSANPWEDLDAQAFFDANTAGIFVATSASNDGPGFATLGSPADAPWVTSVGASTHDRKLANGVTNMAGGNTAAPADIVGKGITSGVGPAPIVYAGDYPSSETTTPELCGAGTGDPATGEGTGGSPWTGQGNIFEGAIVVCDRGEYGRVAKGGYVAEHGAIGYILANDAANGDSLTADNHVIPGVHITFDDGVVLKAWLADGASDHTGSIAGLEPGVDAGAADVMASFSSRGANPAAPSLIKPDVTAPGVDILAAWMADPVVTVQDILLQGSDGEQYNIISGTSMSSPHTAGAGALIRSVHPDWTPDEVKSALMTTAFTNTVPGNGEEVHEVKKENGVDAADPFDMGAGRIDLHVAANAGFVLGETPENYDNANPSVGGDATVLNIASLGSDFCPSACTWTRTIRGTAPGVVSWTATGSSTDGLDITVSPSSFSLAQGESQTLTFVASVDNVTNTTAQGWAFGEVRFSNVEGIPPAHFPVAVKPEAGGGELMYLHGNLHDSNDDRECTGNGNTDATDATNCRPFLSAEDASETDQAAAYTQTTGLDCVPNETSACLHDPNWIWNLGGTTSLQGPMQFGFWFSNPESNPALAEDFDIKIWADGVLVFEERVRADNEITQVGPVPYYLTGSMTLPLMTADSNFLFIIDPVFVNQQGSVLYDSQQPCPGKINGTCESFVVMPVIDRNPQPPVATDDNAFVTNGGSVNINVLANDFDPEGGPLAVTVLTQPANGVAAVDQSHAVTYTHNGSATTADSFTYEITDNQGLKDTATVNITIGGKCQIAGGTAEYDFEGLAGDAQGWTVDTAVNFGVVPWTLTADTSAPSGTWVWYTDAAAVAEPGQGPVTKDDRLVSPPHLVTGNSVLSFSHKYLTEAGFDGGVLEVLVDGETSWQDIEAAGGAFVSGGYDGRLDGPARDGWNGTSTAYPGYNNVLVDLGNFAGKSIQVRFRMLQDQLAGLPPAAAGWYLDDVAFSNLLINDPDCDPNNQQPVANDDTGTVDEGQSVTIDVRANDSDPDHTNDQLTVTIEAFPSSGLAEVNPDGTITYTHDGGDATSDSFQYRVTDPAGAWDTATVSITINQSQPPIARADSDTVAAGGMVTTDVKANDSDPDTAHADLAVTDITVSPTHGSVEIVGTDSVKYTHNGNTATTDSYEYQLEDPQGNFDRAIVTITIDHGNNADPVAEDDTGTVDAGQSVTVDVLANDTDDNHARDELTVTIETSPASGIAAVNGDGSITYTHGGDAETEDSFDYRVTDPQGAFDIATVTITINQDGGGGEGQGRVHGAGFWDRGTGQKHDKIDFSFDARSRTDGFKGKLKVHDKDIDLKIDAKTITSLSNGEGQTCWDVTLDGDNSFVFTATGRFEMGNEVYEDAQFFACGIDNGKNNEAPYDTFFVGCVDGCGYNTAVRIMEDSNEIAGGNIHLKEAITDPDTESSTSAAPESGARGGSETTSGASAETGPAATPASSDPEASHVVTLEPILLSKVPATTPMVVTALFESNGAIIAGMPVTLRWVTASGLQGETTALVNASGIAGFVVTVPDGDVDYIATVGEVESNGVRVTGF